MVYNELTDADATPARAAARLNRQLLRRELQSAHAKQASDMGIRCQQSIRNGFVMPPKYTALLKDAHC